MAVLMTNKRANTERRLNPRGIEGGGRRSLKDLVMATGLVSRKVSVEE
jgi:hypothetical protein